MAITNRRLERRALPRAFRPAGHHVGMAQEGQRRTIRTMRRPQIVDLAMAQVFDMETRAPQAPADQRQATGVFRRHRAATDQVTGEIENVRHGYSQCRPQVEDAAYQAHRMAVPQPASAAPSRWPTP